MPDYTLRERNINLESQPALLQGCARLVRQGAAWRPARMTPALEEFYSRTEAQQARAVCASGIRLAIRTNTSRLQLSLQYHRACRPLSQCDIFINGRALAPCGPDAGAQEYAVKLELDGAGDNQVEIYLPHCREIAIAALEIDEHADFAPLPPAPRRWLAIGDSITQGMTAATPARTWTARLARQLGLDLHNIAVGGAIMEADVGRLALELPWHVATVAFGVNDFNLDLPPDQVQAAAHGLLEQLLRRPQGQIHLLTPIPWAGRITPNKIGLYLEDYRQALRRAAAGLPRVNVIEGLELVDDDPALFVDSVHPNNAGMAQFAERLGARLAPGQPDRSGN